MMQRAVYLLLGVMLAIGAGAIAATGGGLPSRPTFQIATSVFDGTGGTSAAPQAGFVAKSPAPTMIWDETDQSADSKMWRIRANGGAFDIQSLDDVVSAARSVINVPRTPGSVAITSINFGNVTDNPTYAFLGSGAASFSSLIVTGTISAGGSTRLLLDNTNPFLIRDFTNASTRFSFGLTGVLDASSDVTVGGVSLCRSNGTNCPASTGTFTGTIVGGTTSPTCTVRYAVDGSLVTLQIPGLTVTSNSTGLSLTGIPVALRPATRSEGIVVTNMENAGVLEYSALWAVIETSGGISFMRNAPYSLGGAGWTNSATTKGIAGGSVGVPTSPGIVISYTLN